MFGSSPIEVLSRNAMVSRQIYCEQFTYPARFLVDTPTALAANGSQAIGIQIDSAWDFVVQRIHGVWYDNNTALDTDPNALVRFQRESAGKYLSSAPMHWLNVMGSFSPEKVPNSLSFPILLGSGVLFNVEVTNLMATAPDQVEIQFEGYKIYYKRTSRENLFGVIG